MSDEEVARVTATVAKRVVALLIRRGLLDEDGPAASDPLAEEEPLLAACAQASVGHRIATGLRAGKQVMRLGDRIEVEDVESRVGEQCAAVQGFSLHAGVATPGQDRKRIERLCRYISRPPIARERLSELQGGRIAYELRHRRRDGTTHVVWRKKPTRRAMIHFDQGSQYGSDDWIRFCRAHKLDPSMSRRGICWTMPLLNRSSAS